MIFLQDIANKSKSIYKTSLLTARNCVKLKMENVQYSAYLSITGAIQGIFQDELYQELGLKSLNDTRWYRKLVSFYKIINNLSTTYLTAYLSNNTPPSLYITRITCLNVFRNIICRTKNFKDTSYPYCINEWSKLDEDKKNQTLLHKFKAQIIEVYKIR